MIDTEPTIPDPDAAGLIPYFEAPADEPNPDDREAQGLLLSRFSTSKARAWVKVATKHGLGTRWLEGPLGA